MGSDDPLESFVSFSLSSLSCPFFLSLKELCLVPFYPGNFAWKLKLVAVNDTAIQVSKPVKMSYASFHGFLHLCS